MHNIIFQAWHMQLHVFATCSQDSVHSIPAHMEVADC